MALFSRFQRKSSAALSPLYDVGFHGDEYLLSLVDSIMKTVKVFIETGTNVGSTLAYVARTYPHVTCLSCEPVKEAYKKAVNNTRSSSNVSIYNETSNQFFERLEQQYVYLFKNKETMFWLDAHGYGYKWPLKQEIAFITAKFEGAYVLIDDFKVPGLKCFGYDEYRGQECSFDYIQEDLNSELEYRLYYPDYTDRTSKHHPLRGWGLIQFGHDSELRMSDLLVDKVRRVMISP